MARAIDAILAERDLPSLGFTIVSALSDRWGGHQIPRATRPVAERAARHAVIRAAVDRLGSYPAAAAHCGVSVTTVKRVAKESP
jgi:hypothetical protein